MKILITSGGCKVPIDDVRNIGNFSSGRYGSSIAEHFTDKENVDIIFFHERGTNHTQYGPVDVELYNNSRIRFIEYKDYYDYLKVKDLIKEEQPDIIISAAAISDYIVDKTEGKISSDGDELVIRLRKGEKVIKSFRSLAPNAIIVGFKLLVSPNSEEVQNAISKVFKAEVDYVVFNDLTELRKGNQRRVAIGKFDSFYSEIPEAKDLVELLIKRVYP
jgi:phosphopantothenoylcysteine decarboxylase/phosphopantothenate--cysteine ligase